MFADNRDLERLRYRQGQMLLSRDFRDQKRVEAQLRWWHNRAIHGAFGIATGFEAALVDGGVKVKPGLAYDCFGREIVLVREEVAPFPLSFELRGMTLVARYDSKPILYWKAGAPDMREGVPIVRVVAEHLDKLPAGVTIEKADSKVRGLTRPRIGYGSTIPNSTDWELWTERFNGIDTFIGYQVRIDTSAAGFTEAPCYFAWMEKLLTPFDHIEQTSISGFTFRFFLPGFSGRVIEAASRAQLIALAGKLNLSVCWLGIQGEPEPIFGFAGGEVSNGCA